MQKLNYGEKRTTGDLEGEIIEKSDKKIKDIKKVEKRLNSFLGEQFQIPPKFSAIKIDGKKLYEYARAGENIKIPERKITIYNIKLLNFDIENQIIKFEVNCSKGTYIRTLCEDIAEKLGTVGYMSSLRRTRVGNFTLDDVEKIFSIEETLKNEPEYKLKDKELSKFLNGVKIKANLKDGLVRVYDNDKFIGVGEIKTQELRRKIVV